MCTKDDGNPTIEHGSTENTTALQIYPAVHPVLSCYLSWKTAM